MNYLGSTISLSALGRRSSVTRPSNSRTTSNYEEIVDLDNHDETLTALFHAIKHDRYGDASDIIFHDNRIVHRSDEHGRTALHYAAQAGQDELVNELLALGADPDAEILKYKHTPLHLAAQRGHRLVVETLLDAGSDPCAENKLQKTPLHYAAEKRHGDIVKVLLEAGADRTVADRYGFFSGSVADSGENLRATEFSEQQRILQKNLMSVEKQRRSQWFGQRPIAENEILCRYFQGAVFRSAIGGFARTPDSVFDIINSDEPITGVGDDGDRVIYLPVNNVSH
jgi:hypothetical protein